ncbi:MAG: site-specific integrase [Lentisphaeria bacterium]|nr:site-specific integrase [Lentisphaeria bacterium]
MGTRTRGLTDEELWRFLPVICGELPRRLRPAAAAAALCLGTGGRIGEILGMRQKDIFGLDGEPLARVSRTVEKTREKRIRKTVVFDWRTLGAPVLAWRRERLLYGPEALFVGEAHYTLWWRLRELYGMAGIKPRALAFHGLRKSYLQRIQAVLVRKNGGNVTTPILQQVQRAACHARLETTLAYLNDGALEIADEDALAAFAAVGCNRITLDTQNGKKGVENDEKTEKQG